MATLPSDAPAIPTHGVDRKRDRILRAAQELFTEQGFDAAPMEAIARRARVSKGTLYNFFDSKEDLLVCAVFERLEGSRRRVLASLSPAAGPSEMLRSVIRALLVDLVPELSSDHSLRSQVWGLVARDPALRRRVFDHYRAFYRDRDAELNTLLQSGLENGALRFDADISDVALLLSSVFDGLIFRASFDAPGFDGERACDAVLSLLGRSPSNDGPAGQGDGS